MAGRTLVLEAVPEGRDVVASLVQATRLQDAYPLARSLAMKATEKGTAKYYGVIRPDRSGLFWYPELGKETADGHRVASPFESDIRAARGAGLFCIDEVRRDGGVRFALPVNTEKVHRSLRTEAFHAFVEKCQKAAESVGLPPRSSSIVSRVVEALEPTPRTDDAIDSMARIFAPSPGKISDKVAKQYGIAHAWVLYTGNHLRNGGNGWLGEYELVTIDERGKLLVRSIPDSPFLESLHPALAANRGDKEWWEAYLLKSWKAGEGERNIYVIGRDAVSAAWRDVFEGDIKASWALVPQILAELNQDILRNVNSVSQYNLLHADGDRVRSESRIQVASAYAGVVEFLTTDTAGRKLLDTVDSRRKLAPAFAKALKTERWVIRRIATTPKDVLRKLSGRDDLGARDFFTRNARSPVAEVAHRLQLLGPGVRISTTEDVLAITRMVELISGRLRTNYRWAQDWAYEVVGKHLPALSAPTELNALAAEWANDGVQEQEFHDYFGFVHSVIEYAVVQHGGYAREAWQNNLLRARGALFGQACLPDIKRWCIRYHDHVVPLLVRTMRADASGTCIPPLLEKCVLPNTGWTARQLQDPIELREEGERMEHCVYTYARAVQVAATTIFSLRAPDGDGITVEMQCSPQGAWSMSQARGKKNVPIEAVNGAVAALDEFLDVLERSLPSLPAEVHQQYTQAVQTQWWQLRPNFHNLVECYGLRAWEAVRNCMPGSAHGRLETKLWDAYVRGNSSRMKRSR